MYKKSKKRENLECYQKQTKIRLKGKNKEETPNKWKDTINLIQQEKNSKEFSLCERIRCKKREKRSGRGPKIMLEQAQSRRTKNKWFVKNHRINLKNQQLIRRCKGKRKKAKTQIESIQYKK